MTLQKWIPFAALGFMIAFFPGCTKKEATQDLSADSASASGEQTADSPQASAPSGADQVQVTVIKEGKGATVERGNTVSVHYTGTLEDGKQFDTSVGRGPFEFQVGMGQVIQGWDQSILGMKVGEKRKLVIPPALAYGPRGVEGAIPPNATLVFEVEVLSVKKN